MARFARHWIYLFGMLSLGRRLIVLVTASQMATWDRNESVAQETWFLQRGFANLSLTNNGSRSAIPSNLCVGGISTGQWLLFVNFKIDVVDSVVPQPKNYDQLKVQAHGNWFEIT